MYYPSKEDITNLAYLSMHSLNKYNSFHKHGKLLKYPYYWKQLRKDNKECQIIKT